MDFQLLLNSSDMSGYCVNVTGTPVVSAANTSTGSLLFAGRLIFTFENFYTVSCTPRSASDASNPALFSGFRAVLADGTTANTHLVPGWAIVFSDEVQAGDQFEIGAGCLAENDGLAIGLYIPGGVQSNELTLEILNDSGGELSECALVITNKIFVTDDIEGARPFSAFWQTGDLDPIADTDTAGALVTFGATFAIYVDGYPIEVVDLAIDEVIPPGGALTPGSSYRFADGTKYQSGTFTLSAQLRITDTARIHVSGGGAAFETAPSISDLFAQASHPLALTQTGQEDGIIQDGESVSFVMRTSDVVDLDPSLNPYGASLRVVGIDGSDEEHSCDFCISFSAVKAMGTPLVWRIQAVAQNYNMPRYSETSTSVARQHYSLDEEIGEYYEDAGGEFIPHSVFDGQYVYALYELDEVSGTHVKDPLIKDRFILAAEHTTGGAFTDLEAVYAGVGITFPTT